VWVKRLFAAGLLMLALIQIVPFGRDHINPVVTAEPRWDSQQTRDLAVRACFDCHSNETEWPWYTNVAPVSWLTYRDVVEGREVLNFSEWDRPQKETDEAVETLLEGEMPPWYYLPTHAEANLSDEEIAALAEGLRRTLG
jgi:mono/diheme cytochrome c family protein